jgi:3-isopropylmalate/(R)-2-methylmalate dehydratase small subunit
VTAPDDSEYTFSIAPADQEMLLEGLDAIAVTLRRNDEIAAFEQRDKQLRPWIYLT